MRLYTLTESVAADHGRGRRRGNWRWRHSSVGAARGSIRSGSEQRNGSYCYKHEEASNIHDCLKSSLSEASRKGFSANLRDFFVTKIGSVRRAKIPTKAVTDPAKPALLPL